MPFDAARNAQGIGCSASRTKSQFTVHSVGMLTASAEYKAYARATAQWRAFGKVDLYLWTLLGTAVVAEAAWSCSTSRGRCAWMPPQALAMAFYLVAAHTLGMLTWMPCYDGAGRLPLVATAFAAASVAVFAVPESALPSGPLLPRAAAEERPLLVYAAVFAATFLPGFVLFYMRFATRRLQAKPVVWHPLAYCVGLLAAGSVLWLAVGLAVVRSAGSAASPRRGVLEDAAALSSTELPHLARLLACHSAATATACASLKRLASVVPARHGAAMSALTLGCMRLAGVSAGSPWLWLAVVALGHSVLATAWRLRHVLHSRAVWNLCVLTCAVVMICMLAGSVAPTRPGFVGVGGVLITLLCVGYLPDHDAAAIPAASEDFADTDDDDDTDG